MTYKEFLQYIFRKGNAVVVLLFLWPASFFAFDIEPLASDTIIIDGKLVVVNRVVQYQDEDPKEDPPYEPSTNYRISWGMNILPNLNYGSIQSTGELESLQSFIEKPWSGELGFDGSINGRIYQDYDRFYSVGLGFSLFKFQNEFFSLSSLDDSLWKYESFDPGNISQITLHRFDIGSETDTLDITLRESDLTLTAFRIPMSIGWYLPDGKKANSWVVETGLVHHFVVTETGGPVILLNRETDHTFNVAENIGVRKYGLSAFAAAGMKWRLTGVGRRDKVSASVRGYVEAPLFGVTDKSTDIALKYFKFGFQLSLNVFLPDKG
jgi:hypothetical protein